MTEDQLARETLAWLQDVGYTHRYLKTRYVLWRSGS